MVGFEPTTPALRKRCSTAELHRQQTLNSRLFWLGQPTPATVFATRTDTLCRSAVHHARSSSYSVREAEQALPRLPAVPHATRRWAKKVRGKLHHFGPWDDPDGALAKCLEQKDALHAGRKPREDTGGLTVKEFCNRYLNHKQSKLDADEIAPRTWGNCKEAGDLLVSHFGKGRLMADLDPDNFAALRKKMTGQWGPVRVRDFVQRICSVFKYGFEEGLMPTPMRFGKGFEGPSRLETVGGEAKDRVAVDHATGHARDDMASVYRERIGDDRLRAVAERVRRWPFGEAPATGTVPAAG
jgi:hypothetical protein